MIQIDNCQLEIDVDRGVLYVHSSDGITLVRVCQIPDLAMEQSYDKRTHRWKGLMDVVYDRELAKGSKEDGEAIARELGIRYDGVQEQIGMQFTDIHETGTSFYADSLEEAREELAKKRKLFRGESDEGVTHST